MATGVDSSAKRKCRVEKIFSGPQAKIPRYQHMEEDPSIEELFTKLRSYERTIRDLLKQDKGKKFDTNLRLTTKYLGSHRFFSSSSIAEINEILLSIDEIEGLGPTEVGEHDAQDENEENVIAEQLRECCDVFGKEKDGMLTESAGYLLNLGKIYMKYALNSEGVQKKLNFIKSSALIVGAILRYAKLKLPDEQVAKNVLTELHENVIEVLPTTSGEKTDLLEVSQEIKCFLEKYRSELARMVDQIVRSQKTQMGQARYVVEPVRISQVKKICELSTKYYIDIMARIAEKCKDIMGKPPCRFAIVGLGSLARNEVTLYSDFEHAIVLDEEVSTDSPLKEYFRWFTTVFHILAVELGETVIPSVNVKGLCDVEDDGSWDNWFSDEYTPNGMSFDGMMPHACKIPLGRQTETKFRKHTVELIQPITAMVQFLTKDEEIKNGYLLSDVLSKTCFVYGCRQIYDEFCRQSNIIISDKTQEDLVKQQLKNVFYNSNENTTHPSTFGDTKMDVKASTYRPITTLLSCIASLRGITARSSFEIVDKMKEIGIIEEGWYSALLHTVAVTMEARLRIYRITGHQRNKLFHSDVADLIGESSAMDCYITLGRFAVALKMLLYESWKGPEKAPNLPAWINGCCQMDGFTLINYGQVEEAEQLGLNLACEILESFENNTMAACEAKFFLQSAMFLLMESFYDEYAERCDSDFMEWKFSLVDHSTDPTLEKLQWVCEVNLQLSEDMDDDELLGVGHLYMSILYYSQHRYPEALREFDKRLELRRSGKIREESVVAVENMELRLMLETMNAEDILERTKRRLSEEIHYSAICYLRLAECHALLDSGSKVKAKENLHELSLDLMTNATLLGKSTYQTVLRAIWRLQEENDFISDLQFTCKLLSETTAKDFVPEVNIFPPAFQEILNDTFVRESNMTDLDAVRNLIAQSNTPQIQKVKEFVMLRQIWLRKIHTAFSYAELIDSIDSMLRGYKENHFSKYLDMDTDETLFMCFVSGLMTLLEKVRIGNLDFAANELQSLPTNVLSLKVFQPFVYAFFADFLSRTSVSQDQTPKTTYDLLQELAFRQNKIFESLFGSPLQHLKMYNAALLHFTNFRFQLCATLLWKLLHFNETSGSVETIVTEFFLTILLTALILQKRNFSPRNFAKTHEISLKQTLYLAASSTGDHEAFAMGNLFFNPRYLYFSDPLVPVYNLAVECNFSDRKKSFSLLWKILHAPNSTELAQRQFAEEFLYILDLKFVREMFSQNAIS